MNVEDLKRILPLESSSQLVSNSQDYILIPKSTYQQMAKVDTRDVLQSIKQPEQLKY